MTKTIESSSAERLAVVVRTTADPTGVAPSFAVTNDYSADPAAFVDGLWAGSFDATTGLIDALTPVMGDGQALDVDAATGLYVLWVRWTVGVETPIKALGEIHII